MAKYQLFEAVAKEPIGTDKVLLLVREDDNGDKSVAPSGIPVGSTAEQLIEQSKVQQELYSYMSLELFTVACPDTWEGRGLLDEWED